MKGAAAGRGRFIVVEGPDGAGTTTQAARLRTALEAQGFDVLSTAEPSDLEIGRLIRLRLQAGVHGDAGWRSLALMFAADRLDHLAQQIEPALQAGRWVVSDRYTLSSLVYQSLHCGHDWVLALNQFAPLPDLTLLVTLPLEEALLRISGRGGQKEVYDQRALQERVHDLYRTCAADVDAIEVSGAGMEAEVAERLWAVVVGRGW